VWRFYSLLLAATNRSGLRQSRLGERCFSLANAFAKWAVRTLLVLRHKPVSIRGQKMYLASNSSTNVGLTLQLVLGQYEEGTTRLFEHLLKPGMIVMDVGAHVGYYTLLAASRVGPTGRVYAFEPASGNLTLLRRNIEANGFKNVCIVPELAFSHAGPVRFYLNPWGSDRHSVWQQNSGPGATVVEVQATTIDDFLEKEGCPAIDLLKMDIEGAEPAALKGMRQSLARNAIQHMLIEFSPLVLEAGAVDPLQWLQELEELGFHLSRVEQNGFHRRLASIEFASLVSELRSRQFGINLLCEAKPASREFTTA
jgi:FkbM family methyltransferase